MTDDATWSRRVDGPAMHALVVGVAGYPSAKPGQGHDGDLRGVPDVPCTVASARRLTDWLVDNADRLTPPLASLDLLVSEGPPDPQRAPYPMRLQPRNAVMPASTTNVEARGRAWRDRFRQGDSAFFFISGHGATKGDDAVVFLEDLNADDVLPWGAFLNVSKMGRAMRGDTRIKAAFLFSDACQEYNERFAQVTSGEGAMIFPYDPRRLIQARDKVSLITAASQGHETLEGSWDADPRVMMGRFTQVLLQSLSGDSVRRLDDGWGVYPRVMVEDLKVLYGLRGWTELFEPSDVLNQNERYPIIMHDRPEVPVVVKTRPEDRISACSMEIFRHPDNTTPLVSCAAEHRVSWHFRVSASEWPHTLLASHASGSTGRLMFVPSNPIFGRSVALS